MSEMLPEDPEGAQETDVTESVQHRSIVDGGKHGRVLAFGGALHYGDDVHRFLRGSHPERHPVMQRRTVRVTFEYGPWEDVPLDEGPEGR